MTPTELKAALVEAMRAAMTAHIQAEQQASAIQMVTIHAGDLAAAALSAIPAVLERAGLPNAPVEQSVLALVEVARLSALASAGHAERGCGCDLCAALSRLSTLKETRG